MQITEFTEDQEIQKMIKSLNAEGISERAFSDCIDEKGHQYVDLVLEGGGVLGVALVGYTWLLEQMGIRFGSLAGTSAGAINAMLLASHIDKEDKAISSEWVLNRIANTNFEDFMDGSSHARKLVFKLLDKKGWLSIGYSFLKIRKHLGRKLGLHSAETFQHWITQALGEMDINSSSDLIQRLKSKQEGVRNRFSPEALVSAFDIKLITAELSTQSKIQLPAMASLFWEDAEKISPALFVRASMSIPLFFEPLKVPLNHWNAKEWESFTGFRGPAFKEATLVDGGLVSNFPIHVFHKEGVPSRPTFGIKLNNSRAQAQQIDSLGSLGFQSFSTARHLFDYDFLYKNPDYRRLIGYIDTGTHHWLNFRMTASDKLDLFRRGVKAAAEFLKAFDWEGYKNLRSRVTALSGHGDAVTPLRRDSTSP